MFVTRFSCEFPLSSSFVDSPLLQTTPSHKSLNVAFLFSRNLPSGFDLQLRLTRSIQAKPQHSMLAFLCVHVVLTTSKKNPLVCSILRFFHRFGKRQVAVYLSSLFFLLFYIFLRQLKRRRKSDKKLRNCFFLWKCVNHLSRARENGEFDGKVFYYFSLQAICWMLNIRAEDRKKWVNRGVNDIAIVHSQFLFPFH